MKWKTKFEIQRFTVFFKYFFQTLRDSQLTIEVSLSPNLTIRMINLNVWECIQTRIFKVIKRNSRTRQEEIKSRSYKLIMETPACTIEWHSSVFLMLMLNIFHFHNLPCNNSFEFWWYHGSTLEYSHWVYLFFL